MQVMYGNGTAVVQLEHRKKSWPNYTLKALLFACAMLFSAYMNLSSLTSITIKILFVVDIIVFFIINGVLYINPPDWGNALVCISCLLLQVALCLLTVPFNGCYAFAIFLVVCLILVVTLLQPKFQHSVKKYVLPTFTTNDGNTQGDIGDQENHYLNHLFDISNGIATCGGLVTGIMGYDSYMVRPVTAAGWLHLLLHCTSRTLSDDGHSNESCVPTPCRLPRHRAEGSPPAHYRYRLNLICSPLSDHSKSCKLDSNHRKNLVML
ncbi:hypothetical protein ZEAMMB73_Zm00001d035362 [Zea mays]|jgi:hypothetical protein|uniref:Uncharacterized protein n=2 Tax=Zea mays TaxID=4577 RepID=A0A1D6LG62_MAIZE|nr:hypothetical protein ZEAMMB73_Zm00001d035362 [Zea mays]